MSGAPPAAATRSKIVATIGPASGDAATVDALLDAGLAVARVNCAHGAPDSRAALIALLRQRAAARDAPLAILADLGGPKLRVGRLAGGSAHLIAGDAFTLTTADVLGDATRVHVDYPALPQDVRHGDAIFLNDGLIRLTVTAVNHTDVETRVEVGGELSDRKGLSVPGAALSTPALTDTDLRDLDHLAAHPVDFVGLSFVRAATDVERLRAELAARRLPAAIVAKLEKPQAVAALDAILAVTDAVMVARGDLGVECDVAAVPVLQKQIIRAAIAAGVPVITATQMLESMIASPRPTRAEASDVANAVLDGSDAIMLSAETAAGQYPVEAVRVMRTIAAAAERYADTAEPTVPTTSAGASASEAIGRSACLAATAAGAAAIVCLTSSGQTARAVARCRPRQPIIAATHDAHTWRRLSLVWGVEPWRLDRLPPDFDGAATGLLASLRQSGRLASGAPVVLTAGLPFGSGGATNTLRIERV